MVLNRMLAAACCSVLVLLTACGDPEEVKVPVKVGKLEFANVMEFVKGVESRYPIVAAYPDGAEPRVTVEPLPEGAQFENMIFSWTPPCSLSTKDGYFYRGYSVWQVTITLEGLLEASEVTRTAALLVHEQQQGVRAC